MVFEHDSTKNILTSVALQTIFYRGGMFEVKGVPNCYSPGPRPMHQYCNQEESTASSDTGSVVRCEAVKI